MRLDSVIFFLGEADAEARRGEATAARRGARARRGLVMRLMMGGLLYRAAFFIGSAWPCRGGLLYRSQP